MDIYFWFNFEYARPLNTNRLIYDTECNRTQRERERETLFILREYEFISVVGWMCGMIPNQAFDRIELQMTLIMLGRFRLGAKTKESTMWIWKGFQYRMHQPP